jgi:hypothetical protein
VKAARPFGGPYQIAALEKLGAIPKRLTVEDATQVERGPYATSAFEGQRSYQEHIITAYEIAYDIVGAWTQYGLGMNPACRPGIWVVRERVPEMEQDEKGKDRYRLDAKKRTIFRPANAEEKKLMWQEDYDASIAADAAYGELLIMNGDFIYGLPTDDPRRVPGISPQMRAACDMYKVLRKWTSPITSASTRVCPMCTANVPGAAILCGSCGWCLDPQTYRKMMTEQRELLKGIEPPVPTIRQQPDRPLREVPA